MDDANVPSLLAMTYLGDIAQDDPVYRNTRRFVWSESNPYFFRGTAAEGIGGPHIGADMNRHRGLKNSHGRQKQPCEFRQ